MIAKGNREVQRLVHTYGGRASIWVKKSSPRFEIAGYDDFRILNDAGRPFLYDASLFEVVDSKEPDDWVTEIGEDGERYAYPLSLNSVGFFEDFFDGKKDAVVTFWQVVNHQLAAASETV